MNRKKTVISKKKKKTMEVTICTKALSVQGMNVMLEEAKKINKANPEIKINFIAEVDLTKGML